MGTDESTTDSDRFARVRRWLLGSDARGNDTAGVREWIPSLEFDGTQSGQLRDRLPIPEPDGGPALQEHFPFVRMCRRLLGPGGQNSLTVPPVSALLLDSSMPERLLGAVLPERGPTRDAVGGGASVSRSDGGVINPPGSVKRLLYDARTTTPEYFMGVIPESHETVRAALAESQFARSYVTYPKVLTDDSGGVKRKAASVWVYRPWPLSHFQFHIPLFDVPGEDAVYVYYHHEFNWLRHPLEHLDAEYLNPEFERDRVVALFESAGLTLHTAE